MERWSIVYMLVVVEMEDCGMEPSLTPLLQVWYLGYLRPAPRGAWTALTIQVMAFATACTAFPGPLTRIGSVDHGSLNLASAPSLLHCKLKCTCMSC